MKCKEKMCLLEAIYPRTEASLTCDCECFLQVNCDNKNLIYFYKNANPNYWNKTVKE